ncbi:MAG: hypothetical protein L0154_06870 [Chloroflexi bacterium]|nr:hypothetical protein [Chloroflexota bacterium]
MSEQLDRAYQLIQEDRDEEALDILRPIVIHDPDNAAAWWLISYATDDPKEARLGLINTLKNDPDHQHAREMLDQLNAMDPPTAEERELIRQVLGESKTMRPPALPEAPPSFLDDINLYDDVLEDRETPRASAEPERRGLNTAVQLLLGVILVMIVILLAMGLLQESEGVDEGRADLDNLDQNDPPVALANLTFDDNRTSVFAETDLGTTLFVRSCVCVEVNCSGPSSHDLPAIVASSIQAAYRQVTAAEAQADVDAVGVSVLECGGDDTLYQAYVDLDNVTDDMSLVALQSILTVEQ